MVCSLDMKVEEQMAIWMDEHRTEGATVATRVLQKIFNYVDTQQLLPQAVAG